MDYLFLKKIELRACHKKEKVLRADLSSRNSATVSNAVVTATGDLLLIDDRGVISYLLLVILFFDKNSSNHIFLRELTFSEGDKY